LTLFIKKVCLSGEDLFADKPFPWNDPGEMVRQDDFEIRFPPQLGEDREFLRERVRYLFISGWVGVFASISMSIIEFPRIGLIRIFPALLFAVVAPVLLLQLHRHREDYRRILTRFSALIFVQQVMGSLMTFNEVLMLLWYPVFPLTYFFLLEYHQALRWNTSALVIIILGYYLFPVLNGIPAVPFSEFLSAVLAYAVSVALAGYHYRLVHLYQTRLKKEALFDNLTGALLRKAGLSELTRRMAQTDRRPDVPLFVALFDIDDFKRINDQDGHQSGDRVLAAVAEATRRTIRKGDTFIRLGGEEFLLVFSGNSFDQVRSLAENLRQRIEKEIQLSDGSGVTVSIGLTQYKIGESLSELLHRSDQLMYDAKASGKNQVCWQEPRTGPLIPAILPETDPPFPS
jgi:diguanylate cyclase (GGDEF)-like protein